MSEQSALGATEAAQVVAQLVVDTKAFPDEAAEDLRRLLGHSLSAGNPGQRRHARLGLMIELASKDGEYITVPVYEEVRLERQQLGEHWPDAASLCRAYGHWLAVNRAACRFWFGGGAERVASNHAHAKRHDSYEPAEIVSGLIKFFRQHDAWPSEWEWGEYVAIQRLLGRRSGKTGRLPGAKQVRLAFGTFDNALQQTQRHLAQAIQ